MITHMSVLVKKSRAIVIDLSDDRTPDYLYWKITSEKVIAKLLELAPPKDDQASQITHKLLVDIISKIFAYYKEKSWELENGVVVSRYVCPAYIDLSPTIVYWQVSNRPNELFKSMNSALKAAGFTE